MRGKATKPRRMIATAAQPGQQRWWFPCSVLEFVRSGLVALRVLLCAFLGVLEVIALASPAYAADKSVVDRYNKTCVICHGSGAAGAPKFGAVQDWAPRLAKGQDKLLASVKNGLNAMPPKGMCNDCSDTEYKALIQYMSTGK